LFFMSPRPPRSPLFPYTTLFRSLPYGEHRIHYLVRHAERLRLRHAQAHVLEHQRHGKTEIECPRNDRLGKLVGGCRVAPGTVIRSEEHTSELQSRENLVCRLLLE